MRGPASDPTVPVLRRCGRAREFLLPRSSLNSGSVEEAEMNIPRNAVLYCVVLIAAIGWLSFGVEKCAHVRTSADLLDAVTPALHKEGYVKADVDKIRDDTLPPGVRTVAVAEGTARYGPVRREGGGVPDLPGHFPARTEPSTPPASEIGPAPDALPCDLDALEVDLHCRVQIVNAADREWFGKLIVSGAIRAPTGHVRTLDEHAVKDVRFVMDPEAATVRVPKVWGSVRFGISTVPSAVIGASIGRGRYGGWAQADIREAGTEWAGGIEVRW